MSAKSFNLSHALQIHGWTSEKELLWLAEQASTRGRIAEIGCWMGRSTRAMQDNSRAFIYAIDTFEGTETDGHFALLKGKPTNYLFDIFKSNVDPSRVCTVRNQSRYAAIALDYLKFDMIFIDAAHDYVNVCTDITLWRPLLKAGGLLCGHDYDAGRPGVVKAVRELVPNVKQGAGSIWYQPA